MPDVSGLIRRTSPKVSAQGRIIKGIYYSETLSSSHVLVVFHRACDRRLEPQPFLIFDFRSGWFFLDRDQDGCADKTGSRPKTEIDPAEFASDLAGAEDYCNEEVIGGIGVPAPCGVKDLHPEHGLESAPVR
jgi:hypothetical protein